MNKENTNKLSYVLAFIFLGLIWMTSILYFWKHIPLLMNGSLEWGEAMTNKQPTNSAGNVIAGIVGIISIPYFFWRLYKDR